MEFATSNVPGAQFLLRDVTQTKLPSAFADCVCMLEIIDHLEDHSAALLEAKRILKKDSVLVISFPQANLAWKTIWYFWTLTFGRQWHGEHKHEFDSAGFISTAHRLGFKPISAKRVFLGLINVISFGV